MERRTLLGVLGGTVALATAGCSGDDSDTDGASAPTDASSDSPPEEPEPEGWLAQIEDEFDGFADMTDTDIVPVDVGAGEEGRRFDPIAITVAPGTTIEWVWTGEGGQHNVAEQEEEWENPEGLVTEQGHTWSREFSDAGTHLYECWPHTDLGMRGAIFVDVGSEDADSGGIFDDDNSEDAAPGGTAENAIALSDIELINSTEQAQTADVTVEQGGDAVHDNTYELDAGGSTIINDLPEDSGEYLVRVELQNSDAEVFEESPSALTEADCISLDIEIFAGNPPTINQRATECGDDTGARR